MRITKFGHACVRVEHDGVTVVIDPGVFTDVEAVDGADAVLITHEHADHYVARPPAGHGRADLDDRGGREADPRPTPPTSSTGSPW